MRFAGSTFVSTLGFMALAIGCLNCGGGGGNPSTNTPSSGGQGGGGNVDDVLAKLLSPGAMDKGQQTPQPQQTIQSSPQPAATPGAGGGSSGGSKLDTFDEDRARIQGAVPGWDEGTGLTVKFLKESTGTRLSLIYVDTTAPAEKADVGLWMIQAKATANGQTLGHFVVLLRSLEPGMYKGSPSSKDVVMGALMGADPWDGRNPETTWSINEGSWCEISLKPGQHPGDLEGSFHGKLVDNKGTGYHTIEDGYIYINR